MKALIIVDMQKDFANPTGSLYVKDGETIVSGINHLIDQYKLSKDLVIATKDFHPEEHISFASTHQKEEFSTIMIDGQEQVMWPDHCVQGSDGCELVSELKLSKIDFIVKKGYKVENESYSGFADQNGEKTKLTNILNIYKIKEIGIVGLALDYCVLYTVRDAVAQGLAVTLYQDLTKAVDSDKADAILKEIKALGKLVTIKDSVVVKEAK